MKTDNTILMVLLSVLLAGSALWAVAKPGAAQPEINAVCKVERVVDGDTLWVYCFKGFKANQQFKVRLADINAYELKERGGEEAKKFLEQVLSNHTRIFFDVDEKHTYGKYGRVIAVLYVIYNKTHFLNINYLLVEEKHAVWVDYYNSWHPEDFKKYVRISKISKIKRN